MPFPAEPSFVFADVMRESPGGGDGGDDRVYFFFTEVSVEYEFVFKLLIPRVARVCKVSASPLSSSGPALGGSTSPRLVFSDTSVSCHVGGSADTVGTV